MSRQWAVWGRGFAVVLLAASGAVAGHTQDGWSWLVAAGVAVGAGAVLVRRTREPVRSIEGPVPARNAEVVRAVAAGWADDSQILPWLRACATSDDEKVRSAAMQVIVAGWADDPGTLYMAKSTSTLFSDGLGVEG
jgi:hypothetical protein